jgi:hypothetical protein
MIAVSVRAPHAAAIGAEHRGGERGCFSRVGVGVALVVALESVGAGPLFLCWHRELANGHRDFLKPGVQGAAANDESAPLTSLARANGRLDGLVRATDEKRADRSVEEK